MDDAVQVLNYGDVESRASQQMEEKMKTKASVKVMNSYDYSHFEVSLSTDELVDADFVNQMRKRAQRLVDEAIRQYKKAKDEAMKKCSVDHERLMLSTEAKQIREKPESEWTAAEKAKIKALQDDAYWNKHDYNYDDDNTVPF